MPTYKYRGEVIESPELVGESLIQVRGVGFLPLHMVEAIPDPPDKLAAAVKASQALSDPTTQEEVAESSSGPNTNNLEARRSELIAGGWELQKAEAEKHGITKPEGGWKDAIDLILVAEGLL